ncbi:MAG: hypothetical protein HY982_03075 [Candidatus Magasanikbacteria bacterium]|nr:hypothetical protein [Candidatus Magasanikbacteria bacterium]
MLSSTINNLILDLKPREREVLAGRFGLEKNKKETLAGLGKKYGITRERIRQIEADALEKLREEARREKFVPIINQVSRHLDGLGGLRRHDLLVQELRTLLDDEKLHDLHLHFLGAVAREPFYYFDDAEFHSFWYVDEKILKKLRKLIDHLEKIISSRKEELILENKFNYYLSRVSRIYNVAEPVSFNYVLVSRKFKANPFGNFGLSQWEEIEPKTMGSKAYLILKKQKAPLHFREVTQEINRIRFDDKKALPQTVHNELIKDSRFVLVGRGMYGLKEYGYLPGTAREIITHLLKKDGPMTADNLLKTIAKQRILQKNTVVLNLHNKKYFRRMPDGKYGIK